MLSLLIRLGQPMDGFGQTPLNGELTALAGDGRFIVSSSNSHRDATDTGEIRSPNSDIAADSPGPMMEGIKQGALVWNPPVWRDIVRWPLPHTGLGDRLLLRATALFTRAHVGAVYGLDNLPETSGPFLVVANHSARRDAVILPALLMLHRGGRPVHFVADWNFKLIPGVGFIYRRAGAIVVSRKPARPRFLNVFKPYLVDQIAPIERARQLLAAGRPVALFPEGTVNRDRSTLLAGRHGAARLSLESGAPVVPVGLRFPGARDKHLGPIEIHIGNLLRPPRVASATASVSAVRNWHARLMSEISLLSGKAWQPRQGEIT